MSTERPGGRTDHRANEGPAAEDGRLSEAPAPAGHPRWRTDLLRRIPSGGGPFRGVPRLPPRPPALPARCLLIAAMCRVDGACPERVSSGDRGGGLSPSPGNPPGLPPPHRHGDGDRSGDRSADGRDRRGGRAPARHGTPHVHRRRSWGAWPGGTQPGSSASTARTCGRRCSPTRAEANRASTPSSPYRATRRLRRPDADPQHRRLLGLACRRGRAGPAVAHPFTYARMGFTHLSRLVTAAGLQA